MAVNTNNDGTLNRDTDVKAATWKTGLVTFYFDRVFIKHAMGVALLRLRNGKYDGHPFNSQSSRNLQAKQGTSLFCGEASDSMMRAQLRGGIFPTLLQITHRNDARKCHFFFMQKM